MAKSRWPVIDTHFHIGVNVITSFTDEYLIEFLDKYKIDIQMLFQVNEGFAHETPAWNPYIGNDYIAKIQKEYPDRVIGLATVNPWYQSPKAYAYPMSMRGKSWTKTNRSPALEEVERAMGELGLNGLKMHPLEHNYAFNNSYVIFPVLEKLQEEEMNLEEEDEDFGDLERIANEAPIIKLVSLLLLQAIKDRASDLHLEPFENSFRIRYRVDGTLHETMPPPRHLQTAIVSRLKVMAQMNIAERRLPQDGRIPLSMADREIDLRVSSLPTVNGESIVMRILDKTMMKMGLEQIGLLEDTLDVFEDLIKNPNGIILVTGPTGCGKTTTLYAALDRIYNPTLKIITTENPVEYQLDGVVQVNINASVGLTFASCLRSILRQDPDVIMVGEIRDLETAQIAIESALTGHLVLSTLHTNDAPSAVTRLVDMDVEPFLVTSSVIGVVAQRLVRTICSNCKEKYQPKEELFLEMEKSPEDVKGLSFYRGRGCVECNYSGYRGRIGIFELFRMSEKIYDLVLKKEPSSAIRRQARAEGMRTLREDGWEKITMGLTTLEEVVRGTL